MSVYIKGMEMPECCLLCPLMNGQWQTCKLLGNDADVPLSTRRSDCPLVPIPNHGDLIDRDALPINEPIRSMMIFGGEIVIAKSAIDDAPIIIPADKEIEK